MTEEFRHFGRYLAQATPFAYGGMGNVYRATDPNLDREVAIKVVHDQFAEDPEYRRRFVREARLLAALKHPNICAIHDHGANGSLWIAMEMLRGTTIDKFTPLSVPDAIDVAKGIAKALDYLHEKDVAHCDIKCLNVIREKDGRVVVCDLGLAYQVGAKEGDVVARTKLRAAGGTPAYASPEQTVGDPIPASDIYSLGCTIFELLSGRTPFQDVRNPVLLASAHATSRRPSVHPYCPACPEWLDNLIARCMTIDPKRRPKAKQVIDVLNQKMSFVSVLGERPMVAIDVALSADVIAAIQSRYDPGGRNDPECACVIIDGTNRKRIEITAKHTPVIALIDRWADYVDLFELGQIGNVTTVALPVADKPLNIEKLLMAIERVIHGS